MSNITILRPTWSGATTAKTFAVENNKIKVVKSYDLGKVFNYATTTVNSVSEIYSLLKKCENKKAIRIYGRPVPGLPQPARRLKENFHCDETNLVLLDADNWKVPDGYSIDTKENIGKTVKHILVDLMKLTAFKDAQFCCLLSSSAWSKEYLRAHLYFLLDEPVPLEDLHRWGYEHNSIKPEYKIDYSLFRHVQPDFISKRICLGFKDTLLSDLRLTAHCDHLSPYVRKVELVEHFKAATTARAGDPYASVGSAISSSVPIGSSWEKTIEMAGSAELGINEPTYRACAQLVQELGDNEVTDNLTHHVNRVFSRMWAAIRKHGVRGDKADQDLYTREKIKGYLTTAVAKKFGQKADEDTKALTDAIAAMKAGASSSVMFTQDCLTAVTNLKISSIPKWQSIKDIIKRELKGRLSLTDLEKAAADANKEKLDLELVLENVIDKFKWYIGAQDNSLYCMANKENGYVLRAISDGIGDEVFSVLFSMMSGHVPKGFDQDIIRLTVSRREKWNDPFEKVPIENRSYSTIKNNKHITYYNLGSTRDVPMQTAVIDENGVRIIPSVTAPVLWKNTTNTLVAPIENPEDEIAMLGDVYEDIMIDEYLKGMRRYTTVSDVLDLIEVIAWQVTTVVNTGTAHLLQITGASNCGKSSSAGFIKDLCDPTSRSLKDSPDLHSGLYKKQELAKTLRGRHVTIFDNLSKLTNDDQDTLCSVSTGWQFDYRVLYSEKMENIKIKKPIILTALVPVVSNEDLRSRTLSVMAHENMKSNRGDMFTSWEEDSVRIRTGLLLFVSKVIKRINNLRKNNKKVNERQLWGIHAKIEATSRLGIVPGFDKLPEAEQEKVVLRRQEVDEISEALHDNWVMALTAWVCHSKLFKKHKELKLHTQDMYKDFKAFIQEHSGETKVVNNVNVTVEAYDIPKDTRQFGTKIGRSVKDITRITGWRMMNTRTSTQRMWLLIPPAKPKQ